jgi:hypothetical protein
MMRRSVLAPVLVLALLSTTAFFGCASADDGIEGEVGQSEDEIALASLYGTWAGQGGAFYSITFTKDAASTLGGMKGRRFEASIDTGIRCITTPCPSQADVVGVYKLAHGTQLTLSAYDKPSREFAKVLGDYSLKIKNGKLTLTKSDRSSVQTFDKVVLHTPTQVLAAAKSYAWPTRDSEYVYRTFDTRAAAEAWGNQTAGSRWLARDGETATLSNFVSGSNDLWSQEFTVDKATLAVTVTGEH